MVGGDQGWKSFPDRVALISMYRPEALKCLVNRSVCVELMVKDGAGLGGLGGKGLAGVRMMVIVGDRRAFVTF